MTSPPSDGDGTRQGKRWITDNEQRWSQRVTIHSAWPLVAEAKPSHRPFHRHSASYVRRCIFELAAEANNE